MKDTQRTGIEGTHNKKKKKDPKETKSRVFTCNNQVVKKLNEIV